MEMARSEKYLPHKHEDLCLDSQHQYKKAPHSGLHLSSQNWGGRTKRALGLASLLAKLVCSKSSEEMLSQKEKVGAEEGTQLVEVLGSKSHDLTLN